MRHKATPEIKEKLIAEDNQVKAELMAGSDGRYPEVDLHALRHITEKGHPLYGRELLDPDPMQPPVGLKRPPSLLETVRDQIRIAKMTALDQIQETEDDADDFDVDDSDMDPTTRWENDYEPSLRESKRIRAQLEQQLAAAEAAAPFTQAPQGQSAHAQPGATPPQRSGGGEDIAQPGGPSPSASQKSSFFGR